MTDEVQPRERLLTRINRWTLTDRGIQTMLIVSLIILLLIVWRVS